MRFSFAAATVTALLLLASVAGARVADDPDFEARIAAEIQKRDPQNAGLFFESQVARTRGDTEEEARLLEQVHERDPWFSHATRRLCFAAAAKNEKERAIALCREAVATEALPMNEAALATTLLDLSPTEGERREAARLATRAARDAPVDSFVQAVACRTAIGTNDLDELDRCSHALENLAPEELSTVMFTTIREASQGHRMAALEDLERARAKGLPRAEYERLRASLNEVDGSSGVGNPFAGWGSLFGVVVGGWLLVFALLLGLGALLSTLTLRNIRRTASAPTNGAGRARGADAALRGVYRVVLLVTCIYYYLSLPILALLLVVMGGGILYAVFAAGHVPIKLVLIVICVVCASLWAMARSLFVRGRDEPPGDKLDLGDQPRLRAVLDEVASRIGTRRVDSVYLRPGTEIAVLERGGMMKQLSGTSERCLVLGAGVLEGMRVRELKAILAHEYGHFHNQDTAGGGFALAVRRSLVTMAIHLVRGGAASTINPVWWFLRAFHAVFLRVSQGASRLQEVLADRWAAFAYGSEAFSRGLRHVVERSVRFDAHVHATLNEVIPKKQRLANLYAHVPTAPVDPKEIEAAIQTAMTRPASPYDSHPRPEDRIEWVMKLSASAPEETEEDGAEAWSLLAGREKIEKEMTAKVQASVRLAR